MKTPKAQFIEYEQPVAKRHLDRVDDPEFQHVLAVALGQYSYQMGAISPVNDAKRVGAQEFVDVLCNLSIPRTEPPRPTSGQLIPPDFRPTADKPFPN